MRVSAQSIVCLGTCAAINAYVAYSNPVPWVTTFALGVLMGTYYGGSDLRAAQDGYQSGNDMVLGLDPSKDQIIRRNVVNSLASPMPGLVLTAVNLLALGLISQRVQL